MFTSGREFFEFRLTIGPLTLKIMDEIIYFQQQQSVALYITLCNDWNNMVRQVVLC